MCAIENTFLFISSKCYKDSQPDFIYDGPQSPNVPQLTADVFKVCEPKVCSDRAQCEFSFSFCPLIFDRIFLFSETQIDRSDRHISSLQLFLFVPQILSSWFLSLRSNNVELQVIFETGTLFFGRRCFMLSLIVDRKTAGKEGHERWGMSSNRGLLMTCYMS